MVFDRLMQREEQQGDLNNQDDDHAKPVANFDPNTKEFALMQMEIVKGERYVLRELGFECWKLLEHPHRYILQYSLRNAILGLTEFAWAAKKELSPAVTRVQNVQAPLDLDTEHLGQASTLVII